MSRDCYEILGHRVLVRSTSADFAAQVQRLLRSFRVHSAAGKWTPSMNGATQDLTLSFVVAGQSKSPGVRHFHFAYTNYTQVGRSISFWPLFRHLELQLNLFLADKLADRYPLHAGAVARDGAGIILPGESGSGKSSLTLALLQQGYSYMSDELAAVELTTGELHSYPKPITIKDISIFPELSQRPDLWFGPQPGENGRDEQVWYVHPEDVAANCIGSPVAIRYIIFPKYRPGTATQLEALSAGQVMERLLQNSVDFRRFGSLGFDLLAKMVEEADCFSLSFNHLDMATSLINELTEGMLDRSTPSLRVGSV